MHVQISSTAHFRCGNGIKMEGTIERISFIVYTDIINGCNENNNFELSKKPISYIGCGHKTITTN